MKRKEFLQVSGALLAGSLVPARTASRGIFQASSGKTKVEAKIYELRLAHAWTLSRGTWNVRRNVFVKLEREGVFGFGEAAPIARYNETAESALGFIQKAVPLLEKDLWKYQDLWREIDGLSEGEHAAKAALDMAVLDWLTKTLGIPLHRFLGLDMGKALATTYSIGIDEIPVMQQKVREAGDFSVLKIKVGTEDDRKIIEGLRRVTDKPFRADANEGWKSKEEALEMVNWMAGKGVELIEQPLPASPFEDYLWLKERTKIPVFADESLMKASDIPRIATGFHGINVKMMKCGGIQEAVRMASIARALGLKLMLGCMIESSLAISAGAAISPLFDYADLDGNLLISNDPFRGVKTVKGRLVLSDKPGLGAEIDVW
jgi:L-alanine-DL-glutamate epimerase-like enolase superfamily enzyme